MTTDRYDIHAKAPVPVPKEQQHDALMALLAERFNLSMHRETRDIPAMVLLAPKMTAKVKPAAAGETYSVPYFARDVLPFTAVPMSAFTNYLSNVWQSPVVDQTGLEGAFDFTLNPLRSLEKAGVTAFTRPCWRSDSRSNTEKCRPK
jgi:uncharacterized protein (TIGR03435 family)